MATLDYLRRARLSVEANGENVRWRPVEHICPARSGQRTSCLACRQHCLICRLH
ncbi:hypothetical protein AB7M26_004008 [Pseudomonas sp. F-14 TE3482]|jgi:hypothetical protein